MRRVAVLVFVFVVVAGCVLLLIQRNSSESKKDSELPESSTPQTTTVVAIPGETSAPPRIETDALVRPYSIPEDKWNSLMAMRERALARNQPVEFYGRVLDQDAHPVEGAHLTFKLHRVDEQMFATTNFFQREMGDEIKPLSFEVVSDRQGWVQVKGVTGFALDVIRLEKEGYLSRYSGGLMVTYESNRRRNTSGDISMTNAFNPTKGYIFHLWKKGPTEPLVRFQFNVPVDLFGTNWYAVNLFRGAEINVPGGDFRFWFLTTNDVNGNPTRQFRFEGPDGGLQLDRNPYPYEAPLEGYSPAWDWLYEPRGDASEALVKRFFIRARGGKIYAHLTWNFTRGSAANISGYFNPNGSRNLEPDPEKLMADAEEIRRLDEVTHLK